MLNDNEMIDNALDEAYAQLDAKAEEKAEAVETKEVSEVKEAPQTEEPAELKAEAVEGKQVSDQIAESEAEEVEAKPSIQMPTFWSAELKAIAAKSDPELVKHYIQHEQQREQYVNRIASENQRGKEFERQMYADLGNDPQRIEAHRASLRLNGIKNEVDELHRYRAWDTVFKADAPTAIADLMRKNNLTPEAIYDIYYNGGAGYSEQPENSNSNAEIEAIKQEFQQYKEQQENSVIVNEINAFKAGKDADGNDRKVFVEAYAPQIDSAITQIRTNYPHLSLSEALSYAYDHVMGQVKQLHGLNAPKPKVSTVDVKKAQAASSSMSGSPVAGTVSQRSKLSGKTFDEKLDNAVDLAMSQHGL